jgi:hypothetical protein
MKYIAHRALIHGPDPVLENHPDQIAEALSLGYDCEIDLRVIDGGFYLGHDRADYSVTKEFLEQPGLWIHAKNLNALHYLSKTNLVYFWHQNDDCVITSNGYIWTYPEKELTDRSIRLMPEWADPTFDTVENNCYAICSDYVELIKDIIEN